MSTPPKQKSSTIRAGIIFVLAFITIVLSFIGAIVTIYNYPVQVLIGLVTTAFLALVGVAAYVVTMSIVGDK